MVIKEFFHPQRMGFHLLLAIGITIALCLLAMFVLKKYTRHGNEIEMSNFIGMDSQQLIQENMSEDFIIVVSDYIFDKSTQPGIILKQNPTPGEMVKKGRKVYLTVASSDPPKVKMPHLQDISLRQAEIMLKAIGLEMGTVIYKPSVYENVVLEQLYEGRSIAAGTEIKMGEKITFVVGKDMQELFSETEENTQESHNQ